MPGLDEQVVNGEKLDLSGVRTMLRAVPYFADLDDEIIDILMQGMQIRDIAAGTTLFLQGEGRDNVPFYLIVQGTVRVYVASLRGREQVLRLFHEGDTFAEVPLFDGGSYPANADALTDVTLAVIPREQVLRAMLRHPEIAVGTVKVMAERLRHFNALIEDLSLRRVVSRVARLLVSEQPQNLTQAQMAAMIGTSREMVNRSLHSLEDDRVIDLHEDGAVIVLKPERLSRIIDEA